LDCSQVISRRPFSLAPCSNGLSPFERDAHLLLERVDGVLEREGAGRHHLAAPAVGAGGHVGAVDPAVGAAAVDVAVQVVRVGLGQVAVELGEVERLDERAPALALGRDVAVLGEVRVDEQVHRDLAEVRVRVVVLHDVQRLAGVAQRAIVAGLLLGVGAAARRLVEAVLEVADQLGPAGLQVDRDARLVDAERRVGLLRVDDARAGVAGGGPGLDALQLLLVARIDLGVGLGAAAGVGAGVGVAAGGVDVGAGEAAGVVDVLDRIVACRTRAPRRGRGRRRAPRRPGRRSGTRSAACATGPWP
jgi:hypothetical protein